MVGLMVLVSLITLAQAAAAPSATATLEKPPAPAPTPPRTVDEVVVTAPKADETPKWAGKLNLDVRGDFGKSDTPYLRQRPTNGCKSMAGGATSVIGKSGVAGGMVCAKSF